MKLSQARLEATIIAKQIVSGDIDAYDGAMKIWKEILNNIDEHIPDDLWPFKSNASAIEDCLWNAQDSGSNHDELFAQCKKEILQAAKLLLASASLTHHSSGTPCGAP